jgi:hypothetical protein
MTPKFDVSTMIDVIQLQADVLEEMARRLIAAERRLDALEVNAP